MPPFPDRAWVSQCRRSYEFWMEERTDWLRGGAHPGAHRDNGVDTSDLAPPAGPRQSERKPKRQCTPSTP
jgi:hypothetical protein